MGLAVGLNELGWGEVPRLTAFTNILVLYLAAGLDAAVPRRLIGGDNEGHGRSQCEAALVAMLDEARRMGRLDFLRRPKVHEPREALSILERIVASTPPPKHKDLIRWRPNCPISVGNSAQSRGMRRRGSSKPMKSADQVVQEIRAIQWDRGEGYFIHPGHRSSRNITGGRDYWRFVYNITAGDMIFDGGITSQQRLARSYREAVATHGADVRVEVAVEHVACSCHSHRSAEPDIHSHEVVLGTVSAT